MLIGRLSIRTKLTLVMTLLLAIISVAVYVYFPARLEQQALNSVVQKAAALTEMTSYSIARGLTSRDPSQVAEVLAAMRRNPDLVYIVVLDTAGVPYASFNELAATDVHFRSIPMRRIDPALRIPGRAVPPHFGVRSPIAREVSGGISADGSVYQTSAPVRHEGLFVGTVYLGISLEPIESDIKRSRATIALVTAIAFMVGVLAVFALSTLITGPLQRIVDTAEQISSGDLARHAEVNSADEVGQLARAFNRMVDRLHAAWSELEQWGKTLEMRVDERTRELQEEVEERTRAEEAQRLSEERYRLLIERNLAGVYVADENGLILSCNEACARIFGYASREEFLASGAAVPYMYPHDRDSILRRLREDGAVTNEEVELSAAAGGSVWALENVRFIPSQGDSPATLEGMVLDITARKRSEEEIAFKAYHDALTRLPNRALFLDRLRIALAHSERNGTELAVLFLDLDDMKAINDTLGHATGDELLKMLGERLTATLRRGDTVARVGGDEFLLLLTQIDGVHDAERVASKVRDVLSEPFAVEDDEIHVTASIGVAMYPTDGDNAEALIRSADGAMYRVKEAGGDSYEICSRIDHGGVGRLSVEQQLREAIERDEFVVYYQPQVNIRTVLLSGAEALVRWNHPHRSIIEPAGFIALAEQTGVIAALGEAVLRKACAQMVIWQKSGVAPPRVAVNVSARQFYQRDFIGMIERVLSDTSFDPAGLELEITESVALQKTNRSMDMLRQLRALGIAIAIDDFGTGHSSLTYLKRFAVDAVKIDKSFVTEMHKHASDEWIVTAILLLATQLGLRTVAEGVETEEQRSLLAEHGCREIQGYLISRPVPAATFAQRFLDAGVQRPLREERIERL